jgi:predicted transcriptional regulator
MVTSIQISEELLKKLKSMKIHDNDRYEDIIWDLLEDRMELSEQTKKHIKQAEKDCAEGKVIPFEEIKKRLKI